jgi:hypothetical protein
MKQKQIHIRISWLTTDSISAQKKTWSLPLIASFSNCRPFWTKSKAKSARALRRTVAGRAGPVLIAEDEAPAPNSSRSSQVRQRLQHSRLLL